MPADRVERKKKTKTPKDVPELGDPDRKRVLNVLAQRRYREKKKSRHAALEAQAKGALAPVNSSEIDFDVANVANNATMTWGPSREEDDIIEEIMRDSLPQDDPGFPPIDLFDPDLFGSQLLEDMSFGLSTSTQVSRSQRNTPDITPSSSLSSSSSVGSLNSDASHFEVPILSTINAFVTIVTALDMMDKVWDPSYIHVLPVIAPPGLPPNLHPTTAQMTIPHHPFLDALPWPSVRDKLICMFSLPSMCRPPIARDDDGSGSNKAMMRLITDIDDTRDGTRIHGNMVGWEAGNELVEEAWEIGEAFYKNWWWCFDGRIIGITNRRRKERGLGPLMKMY